MIDNLWKDSFLKEILRGIGNVSPLQEIDYFQAIESSFRIM